MKTITKDGRDYLVSDDGKVTVFKIAGAEKKKVDLSKLSIDEKLNLILKRMGFDTK